MQIRSDRCGACVPCMQAGEALAANLGDSADASGGQLTSSVLNIIDCLYGGQDAAAASSQAWQQQQQPLSREDQPLKDMPVTSAPAHAAATENIEQQTAPDSQGGADSQAEEQQQASEQASDADSEGTELQAGCSDEHDAAATASHAGADSTQQAKRAQEQDSTSAADEPAAEDSSAEGKAMLAAMDGLLAERGRLQQELSGYLQQLSSREDGEGEPLVMLSEDYAVLVERLLSEGRAQQYRALQGWDGPHRYAWGLSMRGTQSANVRHSDAPLSSSLHMGLLAYTNMVVELQECYGG